MDEAERQIAALRAAAAKLEAQREDLGDEPVDTALAAVLEQLAALGAGLEDGPEGDPAE
jgi:hypothetical protein